MSEPPPPPAAGDAAGGAAEVLTPDAVESVLADFRAWLHQAIAANDAAPGAASPAENDAAPDLHTLLGQMTALRHEVNLQTKAARAQQEQTAEALRQLEQALASLEEGRTAVRQAAGREQEEQLRPLLKTLVELHDALALAGREVQRLQPAVLTAVDETFAPLLAPAPPAASGEVLCLERLEALFWQASNCASARPEPTPEPPRSLWRKWFGKSPLPDTVPAPAPAGWQECVAALRQFIDEENQRQASVQVSRLFQEQQREEHQQRRVSQAREAADKLRQLLDGMVGGYAMSLERLERALQQYDLEPIPAAGQPFDPEQMEVLEAVTGSGQPPGQVLDEVRRGYRWRGRLFRYALVRVAKS